MKHPLTKTEPCEYCHKPLVKLRSIWRKYGRDEISYSEASPHHCPPRICPKCGHQAVFSISMNDMNRRIATAFGCRAPKPRWERSGGKHWDCSSLNGGCGYEWGFVEYAPPLAMEASRARGGGA